MTMGDDRRATASSAAPQLGGDAADEYAPNPFRPVSTDNRITGRAGGARRGVQPTPGSSYYGLNDAYLDPWASEPEPPFADPLRGPERTAAPEPPTGPTPARCRSRAGTRPKRTNGRRKGTCRLRLRA
jgi:hypothetical protein